MTRVYSWLTNILRWFDSEAGSDQLDHSSRQFNLLRVLPFVALHLICLLAFYTGVSAFAVFFALAFFAIRMFAITGFYHRYFPTRPSAPAGDGSLYLPCLGHRRRSVGHYGGRPITVTTISTPIGKVISTPPTTAASGGPIWAGLPVTPDSALISGG